MNTRSPEPATGGTPSGLAPSMLSGKPGPWRDHEVRLCQVGRLHWRVRRTAAPEGLATLLNDPDRFLREPTRMLAQSELITLAVIPPWTPGTSPLLLRRLNYGRLRHRLRDIFRPTRAERAFEHGLWLEQAGVRTPRVLAAGRERRLRWPVRAYLLTEFVSDAVTLADYLTRHRGLPRPLADRLADLLARLHAQGFSHRDLKASNILFDRGLQPHLIDLDGVRYHRRPDDMQAQSDLARLAREFRLYSVELRWAAWRFLRRYCQHRNMEGEFRRWAKELDRRVGKLTATAS